MSEFASSALLGLVQGLTEFLPVSSSGHLSLFSFWLPDSQMGDEQVARNLVLHLGTLLPVLIVYRQSLLGIVKDGMGGSEPILQRSGMRLLFWMFLGSLPTAIIGLAFKDHFEAMFDQPVMVGSAFLATGLLLLATRWIQGGETGELGMKWWQALVIGMVQGMAITPGISRSGSTIAAGLLVGLDREYAARYSFLLSIPAIAGASILELKDLHLTMDQALPLVTGFFTALISGYFALLILLKLVNRGAFWKFSPYLCLVAFLCFWVA